MPDSDLQNRLPGTGGLIFEEPLLFEHSRPGRRGAELPPLDVPEADPAALWPEGLFRAAAAELPEVSEPGAVRHFTRLSQMNFGVDSGLYPLGSCTMKYNPKANEALCRLAGFARLHPYAPLEDAQGALALIHELGEILKEITGLAAVSLLPAAGAQGELTGMLMVRAYHLAKGRARKKVLIPDTAHGTNPASASLCGFEAVEVKSAEGGILADEAVAEMLDDDTAALMLTCPNTLGLFESNIRRIADLLHEKDALLYCDGANLNALMGLASLGRMGVDVSQMNLHKTFSTPHGGGGPGAGPVAVSERLVDFLPTPIVVKEGDAYRLDENRPRSIGRIKPFFGNFGVIVRAYAYALAMGGEGLKAAAEAAILNANYVRAKLKGVYHLPHDRPCMHEVVFSDKLQEEHGVSTLDIAKGLIDRGFHPPTVYFPLVVHGALMIEPTETESLETLDAFVAAMTDIAREARENPQALKDAPRRTYRSRLDEVLAARKPVLVWKPEE